MMKRFYRLLVKRTGSIQAPSHILDTVRKQPGQQMSYLDTRAKPGTSTLMSLPLWTACIMKAKQATV
ncbi:hypothetical protein B1222_18450 [Paenibacillus larvae subsp. pulvifaciens]|uniref:Uncharacterized protein n=2 Tax=Paenibacillus larvae TaxID=1464 RepID=A0A1V0UVS6_9BACL|nr:hypothetical protein [Paenibacillus larvae]AQT85950.1 hypothetical protein B1222_18450 [Paenibacillus larvae subsp. pulvifaciens]ARF69267.1 hypothetical protein B7C51_17760 [Paenibacillus larvae subsp. pulvifaciens]AVF25397.1 hypothetical protein ERICIII_01195 [Paenibacillus larvae subsp. larvae]MCY7518714.1 hypothetical protein [Paenibacillus larvae]MCY9501332.1 hypothetical protein [Paenibacillus larvae]